MLKPEQVPIEVMNAFHLALLHDESYAEAIAAALSAWPGATMYGPHPSGHGPTVPQLILPLPQETRDE